MGKMDFRRCKRVRSNVQVSMEHEWKLHLRDTYGTGVSTGPPFALSSARFFLSFASSIH
jgi:predicted ATP-dependent Lon-type protease